MHQKVLQAEAQFREAKAAVRVARAALYLTTQTLALQDQRSAVDVQTRRMNASVLLIEALGGGWDTPKLPGVADVGGR